MSEHSSPAAESSAFEGDDFSTPNLVLIAIVSTVLLLVTVLVLQVLYYGYQSDLDQTKVIDVRNAEADSALAEQRARLTRYAWTDQSAGLVTIPIERAMQLVVRDEAARQAAQTAATIDPTTSAAPSATSGAVAGPAPAAEPAVDAEPAADASDEAALVQAPATATSPDADSAAEGVPPVATPEQAAAATAPPAESTPAESTPAQSSPAESSAVDPAPADATPADPPSSPGSAS